MISLSVLAFLWRFRLPTSNRATPLGLKGLFDQLIRTRYAPLGLINPLLVPHHNAVRQNQG